MGGCRPLWAGGGGAEGCTQRATLTSDHPLNGCCAQGVQCRALASPIREGLRTASIGSLCRARAAPPACRLQRFLPPQLIDVLVQRTFLLAGIALCAVVLAVFFAALHFTAEARLDEGRCFTSIAGAAAVAEGSTLVVAGGCGLGPAQRAAALQAGVSFL